MALKAFKVTFSNSAGDNAAFLYLDGDNSGTLRLSPNGQATINPGTLTPWQSNTDFSPNGSVFYLLDLNTILSDEQIAGMQFDAGWSSAHYDDASNGRYWAFTPKQARTVKAGESVDLPIARITVGSANDMASTSLRVLYYNVDGLTGIGVNHKTAHFSVALRSRPDTQPAPSLNDKLDCRFVDGHELDHDGVPNAEWIRTSPPDANPTTNAFTLQIQPKAGEPGVQAGTGTTLILSFVSGNDAFGALASPDDISQIRLTTGAGAERWHPTPVKDVPHPYWKVSVPNGCELSGHLRFENVISRLDPGWTDFTLQYKGVPGYRDGQLDIPVYKYGPPVLQYAGAQVTETVWTGGFADHREVSIDVWWACYSIAKMRIEVYGPNSYYKDLGSDWGESGWISGAFVGSDASGVPLRKPCTVKFSIIPLAYPFPTFAEAEWIPIKTITPVDWDRTFQSGDPGDGSGSGNLGGPHGHGGIHRSRPPLAD